MIGVTVYSVAFGGLFALTFASPMAAWVLTVRGRRSFCWLFRYVVPNLKYPANPPSVGDPDTIGIRTALYFSMIVISLAAMIAAWTLRNRLTGVVGDWNAVLIAGAPYFVVVTIAALALPVVNEVPEGFPAVVLWQFRVASLGAQVIMWMTIGLGFGVAAERVLAPAGRAQFRRPKPVRLGHGQAMPQCNYAGGWTELAG